MNKYFAVLLGVAVFVGSLFVADAAYARIFRPQRTNVNVNVNGANVNVNSVNRGFRRQPVRVNVNGFNGFGVNTFGVNSFGLNGVNVNSFGTVANVNVNGFRRFRGANVNVNAGNLVGFNGIQGVNGFQTLRFNSFGSRSVVDGFGNVFEVDSFGNAIARGNVGGFNQFGGFSFTSFR